MPAEANDSQRNTRSKTSSSEKQKALGFRAFPGLMGSGSRKYSSLEELAENTACPAPAGDGTVCSPETCAWFQGTTGFDESTGQPVYMRCRCQCPNGGGAMGRVVYPKGDGLNRISATTGSGQ